MTALTYIGKTLILFLEIITDFLFALSDSFRKAEAFDAEFGRESDISSRFNKGFLITRNGRLTRKRSFENVLVSGPTGCGKTTRLLLKNLLVSKNSCIICNDPSKELFLKSSGYLSRHFDIKTLNFSDSSVSSGFNVLSRIKRPNDVNKIAHMLVASSLDKGGNSDAFWSLQTKSLIQLLIRLILEQPEEYRNMANVHHALVSCAAFPEKVDWWVANTRNEALIADYKALIAVPEKTYQNIIASARAALQLFEDPEIAKTTSHDSIDFDTFRKKPTILFLHNSVSEQKYVSVLNGIFYEQMYGRYLRDLPEKDDLDLTVMLEEASSTYIDILPVALSNTRKAFITNVIAVQTVSQLKTLYRDAADAIVSNCGTKLFFPGETSTEVLRNLETLSGKCVYRDERNVERVKPLITVDEIRMLPENRSLILCGNNPYVKGRTSPYYRSLKFSSRANVPPIALEGDIPKGKIKLLP